MDKTIFFVAGIHGVGKSTLCQKISDKHSIPHYSASDLIKRVRSNTYTEDKIVKNVDQNQDLLMAAISEYVPEQSIVLDGHFCLFNQDKEVERIPTQTFMNLSPSAVILMHDNVSNVIARIENRDSNKYSIAAFEQLQTEEINYGTTIAKQLGIPFLTFNFNEDEAKIHNLIGTIKE